MGMTTADEKKALITRYVDEVLTRGHFEALEDICDPGYRRHLSHGAKPLTLQEQRKRLEAIKGPFADWTLEIEEIVVEGDRAAFRATVRGTQTGPFLGLPPRGQAFAITAIDTVRFENGRFAEHWGGPDVFALLQQLGAKVAQGD